ncbi:MAG: hypothetical protein NDI61_06135 [Bdellovibrionaceae bacterium]|nr:hypothetical protein [Pseudobdellovibrionaceae bacterium]
MEDSQIQAAFENFKNVLRTVTAKSLKDHSQMTDVEVGEVSGRSTCVYGHSMALILVAGGGIRLTFKAHYNRFDIEKIGANVLKYAKGKPIDRQVNDYMREYCNLSGGALKAALTGAGVGAGMSLPLVTRGFDEVFVLAEDSMVKQMSYVWQLRSQGCTIHCGVDVVIDREEVFPILEKLSVSAEEKDSDLEFL